MNNELTPEQGSQLKSWVGQRDSILAEILVAKGNLEKLVKANNDLSVSNTDIQNRITESQGRLDEINKKEKEYNDVIGIENANLVTEKTLLQSEVTSLKKEIELLIPRKDLLNETIKNAVDIYQKVVDRTSILDQVVDHVTRINSQNVKETDALVSKLKQSVQEVIDVNEKNVKTTNSAMAEIPRILFEMQKPPIIKTRKII